MYRPLIVKGDTKKDLVVGAASVGTVATTGDPAATGLTALVVLVSVFFNTIMGRDAKRSEDLFKRMSEADEDPDDFLAAVSEKVRDGDDEILVKLRALVRADLESASPDASLPIAAIGRDYVRGACPGWAARGWVRLLSEVSSREIDALRTLATMTRMSIDAYDEYLRRQRESKLVVPEHADAAGVAVIMSPPTHAIPGHQEAQPESLWVYPTTGSLGLTSGPEGAFPTVCSEDVPRLFDLLVQHGVASMRSGWMETLRSSKRVRPDTRPGVEMSRASAQLLVRAFRH